jgi:hypothetical protein
MTRAEPPTVARRTFAALLLSDAPIGLITDLRADASGPLSTDARLTCHDLRRSDS